jgi:kynurenine formamidase
MIAQFHIDDLTYTADLSQPISIAIPLHFDGKQPNTYDVPKAISHAYEDGTFVGDVRRGGSCNFETMTLTPHCNGTHTECIGHITRERVHIAETDFKRISTALLISIAPIVADDHAHHYNNTLEAGDLLITRELLEAEVSKCDVRGFESLIIRTIPNTEDKLSDHYDDIPAYFSLDAMEYILELGISNLLVDMPSIDRLYDDGLMTNHRAFWQVGSDREVNNTTAHKTVTEFIYAANSVADGYYLLEIQIPPFLSDAAPSTPLLYKLEKK